MVRETRHLWVGNIPETVREDRIRDHFKRSTEDVSPPNFDQRSSGYYERSSSRIVTDTDQYIRRPNNYHSGDIRGRPRDRPYRNGPYSSVIDRSTPVGHHRVPSWYDTSPSSGGGGGSTSLSGAGASPAASSRTVYGNVASAVVQPDTSNNYDCQILKNKKKSRSGSESPCGIIVSGGGIGSIGGLSDRISERLIDRTTERRSIDRLNSSGSSNNNNNNSNINNNATSSHSSHNIVVVDRGNNNNNGGGSAASSRSHSRSPSSCSSTNSTSSNSHASSPVSGSDPPPSSSTSSSSTQRTSSSSRHNILQSIVSATSQSGMICNNNNNHSNNILNASSSGGGGLSIGGGGGGGGSSSSSSTGCNNNNPVVHSEDNRPLAICVRNLPARSSDTSLKDGLFHEYKKHGKVTWVKVVGQNSERYALVCFKKPDDVEKALEVSHDKLFFGCKIEVAPYQGYDVEDNEFRPYEAELDEYHPKSTRTLFIGNLEKDITGSELRKHFECFGEIIEIDIKKQGMNAYAFCQYSDIISVVKAMRKMDGEHLGTNRIKLGFGKSMPTNCVWIDGVTDSVSENHLSGQFSRYGPVSQVVIDRERKLALVSFEQIQYAQTAVKEMRGATLRGRKLQVDFASRECQEAFYDKLDKQQQQQQNNTGSNSTNQILNINRNNTTSNDINLNPDIITTTANVNLSSCSSVVSVPGQPRFNRYESQSRSRASSFSGRHNLNSTGGGVGGAVSPSNTPGSVGSGCSGSGSIITTGVTGGGNITTTPAIAGINEKLNCNVGGTTPRGGRSRSIRHGGGDYEFTTTATTTTGTTIADNRRFRSYDEYSPSGSGASHDDEATAYYGREHRSNSPQSRLGPIVGSSSGSSIIDTLEISSSNSGRRRCDKSPGDIRNLQKERFHLLEQLEECPSSGDELVSPKKRMKFDHSSHHHNHHHTISSFQPQSTQIDCSNSNNSNSLQQPTKIGDSNCDVLGNNHSNETATTVTTNCSSGGVIHNHRKCVEVRRLSECNSLKYGTQILNCNSNNSRRPSTDSGTLNSCSTIINNSSNINNNNNSINSSNNNSNSIRPTTTTTLLHNINSSGQQHDHHTIGNMNTTISGTNITSNSSIQYSSSSHLPCKRRRTVGGGNSVTNNAGSGMSISSSAIIPTTNNSNSITSGGIGSSTTTDGNEYHTSRGRGHQLHSHHSHEASGGESADGSRPGTPLCDERPEVLPSEPRRIPRDRPHEPMMLPLPKWGIPFFQQHRVVVGTTTSSHTGQIYSSNLSSSINISNNNNLNNLLLSSSSSSLLSSNNNNSHSSLLNSLSSPPLLAGTRLSSSSFHPGPSPLLSGHSHLGHHFNHSSSSQQHHHHHHSNHYHNSGGQQSSLSLSQQQQSHHSHHHHNINSNSGDVEKQPTSPLRARSLSSNSSDSSEAAPISTSPSIEERIKTLDEWFEKWSGNSNIPTPVNPNTNVRSHTLNIVEHHNTGSNNSSSCSGTPTNVTTGRHKFLDLDVNELKPSEIVKSVLAKKSIFDDDLQRLKNISDKYEPPEIATKPQIGATSPQLLPNLAATKTPIVGGPSTLLTAISTTSLPTNIKLPTIQSTVFPAPALNTLQRLNSSPMNSPQTSMSSPYNSPSPSPVVVSTATSKVSTLTQPIILTPQPAKGLQYPFPSHPPAVSTCANISSSLPNDVTTTTLSSEIVKPKPNSITKSFSVPGEKSSSSPTNILNSSSTTPNRTLSKSNSIPGSTNIGTLKTSITTASCSIGSQSINNKVDDSDVKSQLSSSHNQQQTGQKSSIAPSSQHKKNDKPQKHNHRNENEKKASKTEKSRGDSIDRRKTNSTSETVDTHEQTDKQANDKHRQEEALSRKKELEEKEEREKREIALKERQERERLEKEKLQRQEKERLDRDRREKELKKREKEEKDREEKDKREREDKDRKEKEERERKEKEEWERKQVEEKKLKELERREKEDLEHKEREERDSISAERKDTDERHRREKYHIQKTERLSSDDEIRLNTDELLKSETSEHDKSSNTMSKEHRKETEFPHFRHSSSSSHHHHREEKQNKENSENIFLPDEPSVSSQKRKDRKSVGVSGSTSPVRQSKRRLSSPDSLVDNTEDHTKRIKTLSTPCSDENRRDSKDPNNSKLSSMKHNSSSSHSSNKAHNRISASSVLNSVPNKLLDEKVNAVGMEERYRKDSGFDEKKCNKDNKEHISKREHHRVHSNSDKTSGTPSTHKHKKHQSTSSNPIIKEEKDFTTASTLITLDTTPTSVVLNNEKDDDMSSFEKPMFTDSHDLRSTDDDEILQQHTDHHHNRERKLKKEHHKDKKRHVDYDDENSHKQQHDLEEIHHQHHLTSGRSLDSTSTKKHDNNRHHERKISSRSEDGALSKQQHLRHHQHQESRNKMTPTSSRKLTLSSDDSNSDEPKKHSIFDIPDDGPYISMYDKVKARSCKNMQKQEEEKKIKAKFSQLKQCRAKREEKKRSTSYDGDSDSDFDGEHQQHHRHHQKYRTGFKHNRSGISTSDEDHDDNDSSTHNPQQRDSVISDSDSEGARRRQYRARLNELCDDDDSSDDDDIHLLPQRRRSGDISSCKKISSKRSSRATRIASDTTDSDGENNKNQSSQKLSSKSENHVENDTEDNLRYCDNYVMNCMNDDIKFKTEIKREIMENNNNNHQNTSNIISGDSALIKSEKIKNEGDSLSSIGSNTSVGNLKVEVKLEIKEPTNREFFNNPQHENISESDNICSTTDNNNKESIYDQLFTPENRKKHKKSKKRQKTPIPSVDNNTLTQEKFGVDLDKAATSTMEHVFDELKRESMLLQIPTTPTSSLTVSNLSVDQQQSEQESLLCQQQQYSEKKKHKERKDRKREKYHHHHRNNDDYVDKNTLTKEERHRLKKSKKASKSSAGIIGQTTSTGCNVGNIEQTINRYGTTFTSASTKRNDEKMEDIFGPISDDESQMSPNESVSLTAITIKKEPTNSNNLFEANNNFGSSANSAIPVTAQVQQQQAQQTQITAAVNPYKQEPLTPKSHTVEENEENKQKVSQSHLERERHRKEKREKKRKEREKSREQHALATLQSKMNDDENSVDLDEAGRVLEAQLMADSDSKQNDEPQQLETPSTATTYKSDMTDVFRFSDGDENSMEIVSHEKKDIQDHHKNKEKKKKKKRSKEERHHQKREHHHHINTNTHNNNAMMSPPSAGQQQSNKLSILISTPNDEKHRESPLSKPSPSLPSLMDDDGPLLSSPVIPTTPDHGGCKQNELNLSISPIGREKIMISPIPKTPTISAAKQAELKKKPDKFIPGFDGELDEKISESAVQSISAEFTSPVIDSVPEEPKIPVASPPESSKLTSDKLAAEEKSRVVISQEETEDAVAALLGESFGNSSAADYSFTDEPIDVPVEEVDTVQAPIVSVIAEEEAEEMRKAVQSLGAEDIDIKADTPQSEQDLQIDTDTEEPDEDGSYNLRFDNCPKTPDIDLSSIGKPIDETIKSERQTANNTTSVITKSNSDDAKVSSDKEVKSEKQAEKLLENIKPPKIESLTTNQTSVKTDTDQINQANIVSSIHTSNVRSQIVQSTPIALPQISVPIKQQASCVPQQQQQQQQQPTQKQNQILQNRSQGQYSMQPPTITIPEQSHFAYPPINVVVSPRSTAGDHRLQSPRQHQNINNQQSIQQHPNHPNSPYGGNLRVQSPHSPILHRGGQQNQHGMRHSSQLSPVTAQHVVIQQRQILSSSPGSNTPTTSNANLVLNRMPMTTVLTPISKSMQPTSIMLPQPSSGQTSVIGRQGDHHQTHSQQHPQQELKIQPGQTLAYQSTRVNIHPQQGTPIQGAIQIGSQKHIVHNQQQQQIKTVIQPQGAQMQGGMQIGHGPPQQQQHIKTVIEGHTVQPGQMPHQTIILQQSGNAGGKQIHPQHQQQQRLSPQQMTKMSQQQFLHQHLIQQQQQRQQIHNMQQQKQLHHQQQQQHTAQMIQMQKMQQSQLHIPQQPKSAVPHHISQSHRVVHQQQQPSIQTHQYQQQSPTNIKQDSHNQQQQSSIMQSMINKDPTLPNSQPVNTTIHQNVVIMRQQHNIHPAQDQQLTHCSQAIGHQQQSSPTTTIPSNAIVQKQQISTMAPLPIQTITQNKQQHLTTQMSGNVGNVKQTHSANSPVGQVKLLTKSENVQQQPTVQVIKPVVHVGSVVPPTVTIPTSISQPHTIINKQSSGSADEPAEQQISTITAEKVSHKEIDIKSQIKLDVEKLGKLSEKPIETSESVKSSDPVRENIPQITKDISPKKSLENDKSIDLKSMKNSPLIVKESENISVIRSQSAATPVQPIIKEKSLLTEENVIKLTSEPLLVDQIEQDSKEDSDYWSAKEIIIESVIKKNDTVVCDDKNIQSKQIPATTDIVSEKLDDDDKKCVEENISENLSAKLSSTEALSSNEQISNDTTKSEPETPTPPTDSSEKNDDTHDEEEFDENQSESGTDTGSNSNAKPVRGGKQRGRGGGGRGGKKLTAIVHPFVQTSPNTTTSPPTTIEGVQTRRGKIANQPPTRGRKGRPPTKAINVPTVGEKKMRNQQMQQQLISSDQDVYEFHDDSGEETSSKTSSSGGCDRPRLILTIKSPGQSSVGSVTTSTTTTTAAASNVLTTTDQNPAANQVKEKPPTITAEEETITHFNTDVASPLGNALPPPSPASAASQDSQRDQKDIISDFQQPAAGGAAANTRKSRRLQEKDRSTVDDVIEDVVRNTLNSPKGGQTPPRRSTRNAQNVTPAKVGTAANSTQQLQAGLTTDKTQIADGKKSPRANRRTKDRKSSDASVDSSDEKVLLSKADTKIKTIDEDPLLQKPEPDRLDNSADDKISETKLIPSISTESSESVKPELSATMSSALINKESQVKKPGDPTDSPLTLIDPVTGVLTVVCQSKEGQYVPIGGRSKSDQLSQQLLGTATSNIVVNKHIPDTIVKEAKSAATADDKLKQQMQINKSSTEISSQIGSSSVADKTHVSSASTVVLTNPKPINVAATIQQQTTVSSPATSVIATTVPTVTPIISQQPSNKAQPIVIQPQLPQQQAIRTHPLKAHVLNSQMNKQVISAQQSQQVQLQQQQQQNIVASGGATLNQSQQNIQQSIPILLNNPNHVIQSNIVVAPPRHLQSTDLQQQQQHSPKLQQQQQHGGLPVHSNLIVNIPSSNSPHLAPILLSPRMQQQQPHQHNVVIKNQQQPQQHIVHQIHQQNTSSGQQQPPSNQTILHVISKQNNQQSHHNQQILIHGNKQISQQQQQQQPHPYSTTTVVQGGKIIQQQQSVTIQAGGKHQTIQVPIQQPQHNIHQKIQQQPPVGGVSVVQSHQLSKRIDLPPSQQQSQHHSVVSSGAMTQQQLQQLANVTNIVQSGRMEIQPGGGVISGSQQSHIYGTHQQHQQSTGATMLQSKPSHQLQHQQQIVAPPTTVKGVIGLHQTPQIMTGAVASPPPLKQSPHMPNQQPVVTGASSLRVSVPPISPQGQQARGHLLPGLPIPGFDANLHDIGNYSTTRSKSPPPAHQQASPITPGDGTYSSGSMRGVPREFIMYQYIRDQARIPYNISRSSIMDPKELSEVEDKLMAAASPPLELRRPGSGSRQIAVPHSLQSPQDRATDSPQVAQVYVHGTRIPHPHYPDVGARYFENVRPMPAEPPPAHRPPSHSGIVAAAQSHSDYVAAAVAAQVGSVGNPGGNGTGSNLPLPSNLGRIQSQHPAQQQQQHQKTLEREQREQREREKERMSIPGHTTMPSHGSLVPVMPGPTTGRSLQVQTPPHGSQVPPQADSLLTLLQRYPVMWQGLLALKTDQAAVQMHFVFGNPHVARGSLPCNSDGSTPPLRIAQRMRLEQTQLEGVAKKMQSENEHCMLLALPCGRDHMDVLQQSRNLQTGFITYLQQKMAAGIVNIPVPGSDQAAYVVHIFPSCEFANENLERAAPDLKHRVAEIAHLLIVIATV